MKLLALDTATEACSVALQLQGCVLERSAVGARDHARMILPMIDAVLAEGGVALAQLDAIAFGRGPGAFTGVRLAASVTQGLAFAADLPVLPISNLRATALQALERSARQGVATQAVLVCQDARMSEVYWGLYRRDTTALAVLLDLERVGPPASVHLDVEVSAGAAAVVAAGSGLQAYAAAFAALAARCAAVWPELAPRAVEIARLGVADFAAGLQVGAEHALPVYLRDDVAQPPRAASSS